jgi:hypothetical protein
MDTLFAYLLALGLTLAIELPVAFLGAPRGRRGSILAVAVFLNLLTHPLANQLAWHLPSGFLAIEILVWLVEGCAYRHVGGLSWVRALLIALVANGLTALLSLFWN